VKRSILVMLVLAACRSTPPKTTPQPMGGGVGAAAPRLAVENFLAAVRAQDLQAMAIVWGTAKGPARDQLERTDLEKRELIMQGCFDHDKFRILDETPGENGMRVFRVELTKGTVKATPHFYAVKGPSERWYVNDATIQEARAICKLREPGK
jgi:hypothetical protein